MGILIDKSKKTKGKGMTLGSLMEQKKKKELSKLEVDVDKSENKIDTDKNEVSSKIEIEKKVSQIENRVQCTICDEYFVTDIEMENDICNDCWILVNKK